MGVIWEWRASCDQLVDDCRRYSGYQTNQIHERQIASGDGLVNRGKNRNINYCVKRVEYPRYGCLNDIDGENYNVCQRFHNQVGDDTEQPLQYVAERQGAQLVDDL